MNDNRALAVATLTLTLALSLAAAPMPAAVGVAGEGAAPAAPAVPSGPSTVVTIGGQSFPCRIVRHDEKSVTVHLTEAGTSVTLQWDQLPESERERLRGLVAAGDQAAVARGLGDEIDGVEVTLKTGATYRGIELAGRTGPEARAFRFARMPFATMAAKDIKSVKPIKIREGELFSPQERYKRRLATSSPQTAEDYFQLGGWCLENGLALEAGDNFAKALLLDPAYEEKVKSRQAELDALKAGSVPAVVAPPADPAALRRKVLGLWHQHLDYHIQRIASTQVSETPAMPVKVVHLTDGRTMEGALEGAEDADAVRLKIGGRTYSIERRLIARMDQKMVEAGPWRDRTLAECRAYATDAKGGITADVAGGIARDLGIDEKEVLDIWAKRLSDKVVVGSNGVKDPEVVASLQEAAWSVGSWLRGGGAGGGTVSSNGLVLPGTNAGRNRGGNQPQQGQQSQQLKSPEDWWKEQPASTKAGILKAMCAEALMKVEKIDEENCPNCGGAGQLEVIDATGNKSSNPCPVCRGSGRFYKVRYR